MPRIPSLESLRIFAVAARHLSFTAAASELNLTQSAISHRIRGLEEELGFPLFERLTRRLELTAIGRNLAQKIGAAIGDIERSLAELHGGDDAGQLTVTMLPSVASHWLLPRMRRICARLPELDIQVVADPRLLDLRARSIDLAIRFCRKPDPAYVATPLMTDRVFPVCSPEFLALHGPVDSIESLLNLPLLHDSAAEGDGSESGWRSWLQYHGRPDIDCGVRQQFSDAGLLLNAAALGLGVALARASLVADQVAGGALTCPLELAAPTAYSYYLLGLPEAADRPDIVSFRTLLLEEAAATEACVPLHGAKSDSCDRPHKETSDEWAVQR